MEINIIPKPTRPEFDLKTSLGVIRVIINDLTHGIAFIGDKGSDRAPFVVRGVYHKGAIHFRINPNGNGDVFVGDNGEDKGNKYKFYTNIYTNEVQSDGGYTGKDSTYATKDKIAEAVINALKEYFKTNPETLKQAFIYARNAEIIRELDKADALRKELQAHEKRALELMTALPLPDRIQLDINVINRVNDTLIWKDAESNYREEIVQPVFGVR